MPSRDNSRSEIQCVEAVSFKNPTQNEPTVNSKQDLTPWVRALGCALTPWVRYLGALPLVPRATVSIDKIAQVCAESRDNLQGRELCEFQLIPATAPLAEAPGAVSDNQRLGLESTRRWRGRRRHRALAEDHEDGLHAR